MAVYDLTQGIPAADTLRTGDILNCPYSGGIITLQLPEGIFKLECWGAFGGGSNTSPEYYFMGANGGYSTGIYSIEALTTLYLCSGGCPPFVTTSVASGSRIDGGYNGGGDAYKTGTYSTYTGGGGATHIAMRTGLLSTLESYQSDIIMVAGGGGGGFSGNYYEYTAVASCGGKGGGLTGEDGLYDTSQNGKGGSQSEGGSAYQSSCYGSFGQGGSGSNNSDCGGGGGYYGGGGGNCSASTSGSVFQGGTAGGGSGYISNILTDASTIQETESTNPDTVNHSGYIKITIIKAGTPTIPVKVSGTWKNSEALVKVNNTWEPIIDAYIKTNGTWKSLS